jgi:putative solute:sodium symporter small subunit
MDLAGLIKKGLRGETPSIPDNLKVFSLDDSTSVSSSKSYYGFVVASIIDYFSLVAELDFQIWIAIVVALVTTIILVSIYLWRKNKIRSKFSCHLI